MKGKFINDFSNKNEVINYFKLPEEKEPIKNNNYNKNINNYYYIKDYLNNMTSLSTLDTYFTNKNNNQKYYISQNENNYETNNPINHGINNSNFKYENIEENQFFYKIKKNNFLNDQDRSNNNRNNYRNSKNLDNNNKNRKNNIIFNSRCLEPNSSNNSINSNSKSFYRNNNKNKTYDYIVNQNHLLKDNGMNDRFNKIRYFNTNPSSSIDNNPKNFKKSKEYHYKYFGNGNIIYKNNQLINNGIENKNYKFNKRTIENGIKLYNKQKLLEQNRNNNIINNDPILMEDEENNKVIKINQIVNMNNIINNKKYFKKNHFFINISPKDKNNAVNYLNGNENMPNNYNNKAMNTKSGFTRLINQNFNNNILRNANSNNINYKINNIYDGNNRFFNNNIMKNNEEEEVEEEVFYDNDNDNDDNEYNNNIYMYFTKTEPIKEVNEDMEDSSSENKVIVPKKNQIINKKNIAQKLKSKKNKNILLEIKKFEQKLFKKNKTILQKLTTDINNKKVKNPYNAQKFYSKVYKEIKNRNNKNKYKRCNTENKRLDIYDKIKSELDDLKSKNKLSNSYKNISNFIKKKNGRFKSPNDFRINELKNGEDKLKNDKNNMNKPKIIKPPSNNYYKKLLKNN